MKPILDMFGVEIQSTVKLTADNARAIKAHKQLLAIHGESSGNKCKNCEYFFVRHFGKKYFKCDKSGPSSGPATDWRANWIACGLFNKIDKAIN